MIADRVEDHDPTNRETLVISVRHAWDDLSRRNIVSHIMKQREVRSKVVEAKGGNRFL